MPLQAVVGATVGGIVGVAVDFRVGMGLDVGVAATAPG